jgi:hypothetical protein
MSKSNPKLQNPCQKFIDIKSDKGQLVYWDKENERQVELQLPIHFVVLDELSTITGYNKKHDCGLYSNEVHNITSEVLRVKTFKGGESVTGLYQDIKFEVNSLGGKYTKSVYAMLIQKGKQPEMINFKFRGSAFSAWLDKKINTDQFIVSVTGFKDEVNGNTNYKVPVFKAYKLSDELNKQSIEMDKVLQVYLKEYKAQGSEKEIAKAEKEEVYIPEPVYETNEAGIVQNADDLPF